jgi:hypothetical protein
MSNVIEPKGDKGKGKPGIAMDGSHLKVPPPLTPPPLPTQNDKPKK